MMIEYRNVHRQPTVIILNVKHMMTICANKMRGVEIGFKMGNSNQSVFCRSTAEFWTLDVNPLNLKQECNHLPTISA